MTDLCLSIVIATFNAAKTLERCLQSIFSQTSANWELLVVDGGSTDGTVDILQSHADRIAYWHSHPDAGIYDAWNQAIAQARGEYICFLGADDAWSDPCALHAMIASIAEATPDLVSAKGLVVDSNGRQLGVIGRPWDYRGLRRRMLVCHPGTFHHRRLFQAFGHFDTHYRIAADYDWMLRLPESTRSLFLDRIVVHVQEGGVSRQQRRRTMAEHWYIQARNPRVGRTRATLTYLDRMWRPSIARLLGRYY